MKFLIVSLALLATVYAALPSSDYLPPLEESAASNNVDLQTLSDSSALSDDGYRYKTVKRLRLRQRRDVNELPSSEYLPPAGIDAQPVADLPVFGPEVSGADASQDSAVLADDGYHYKTVKRYRLRHRRDVSELASEYLPPVEAESAAHAASEAQESAALADDGYRYKTVKRYRLRHRRDVNELPSSEYLPPTGVESEARSADHADVAVEASAHAASEVQESAALADDGYRYKTVKRYRLRHRRDVNELASEYLPPVEAESEAHAASEGEESAALADDGYRYKTVKRYRLRHRRDVNELASEYLPPVEAESEAHAATHADVAVEASAHAASEGQESAALADDGYRYKTVKRYRLRHRRDVNELASEYLPPVEAESEAHAATHADVAVEASAHAASEGEESAALADDGYRYKTVKRYRLRHRRDVNELPSNEYLPPVEAESEAAAAAPESAVFESLDSAPAQDASEAQESAVLADDGYHYKTAKRVVYRYRH